MKSSHKSWSGHPRISPCTLMLYDLRNTSMAISSQPMCSPNSHIKWKLWNMQGNERNTLFTVLWLIRSAYTQLEDDVFVYKLYIHIMGTEVMNFRFQYLQHWTAIYFWQKLKSASTRVLVYMVFMNTRVDPFLKSWNITRVLAKTHIFAEYL